MSGTQRGAGAGASGLPGRPDLVFVVSPTQLRNPDTADLDLLDTAGLLRVIHAAGTTVPAAVAAALPALAAALAPGDVLVGLAAMARLSTGG